MLCVFSYITVCLYINTRPCDLICLNQRGHLFKCSNSSLRIFNSGLTLTLGLMSSGRLFLICCFNIIHYLHYTQVTMLLYVRPEKMFDIKYRHDLRCIFSLLSRLNQREFFILSSTKDEKKNKMSLLYITFRINI